MNTVCNNSCMQVVRYLKLKNEEIGLWPDHENRLGMVKTK